MKILIVGDASGTAPTLYHAFEEMGHSCRVIAFSNPQGRKNIEAVYDGGGVLRKAIAQLQFLFMVVKGVRNADWVISAGYVWLSNLMNLAPGLGRHLVRYARKHVDRLSYLALGCDPLFASSGSEYCQACRKDPDSMTKKCDVLYKKKSISAAQTINRLYDEFIVMTPDYDSPYVDNGIKRYIPLPFKIEDETRPVNVSGKGGPIVVVHAPSGRNRKGSKTILEAMKRFEAQYPREVKCMILEGLEYEEFRKRLETADIVIDQCHSRSYGMLALEALALGKVVLSGGETFPEYQGQCPVIGIRADVDDICSKLGKAILLVGSSSYSAEAIAYVKKVHDYHKVARRIL